MPENIEKYLPYVAELGMSTEQKIELLRNVYYVMKTFVDMAFGVDPTQQAMGKSPVLPSVSFEKAVHSKIISNNKTIETGRAE